MSHGITESVVEDFALDLLEQLGWTYAYGPDISPGGSAPEREDYDFVLLEGRLRAAVERINPTVPPDGIEEALRKLMNPESPGVLQANREIHTYLVRGIEVSVQVDGSTRGDLVKILDFDHPENNDWLVVNQLTIVDAKHTRRPDIVLFVNGLPLGVIELKNAANENATTKGAWNQLQTYKSELPSLMAFNGVLVVSDGLEARVGSLSASFERFQPWRTVDGKEVAPKGTLELETLLGGVFDKRRFLDLIGGFIVFEDDGGKLVKKLAGYHQFHAVREAVSQTVRAAQPGGDRRVGVVWHTQGSGKSLTMAFYAGRVVAEPAMQNPTLLVITDRNDLDDQLFGTFSRCAALLRQKPVQATDRDHLRELLSVASGGVVFTTIQKFLPNEKGERFPVLTDRRNVVVIADEAHRSQYGFKAKVVRKDLDKGGGTISVGFAQHLRDGLPSASFIGFTGTPIELEDKSTRAVFGDYISVYDIKSAVDDGATVPILYEGRLAKLELEDHAKEMLDEEFDELTEDEEEWRKDRLKSRWAALEAVVGHEKRIALIASDILTHFDRRNEAMPGKAMIVCMSRRICVALYEALVKLRPTLASESDLAGELKLVMTGSAADPAEYQPHIRTKLRNKDLGERFRDPDDPFKLVIVRDMWLTGFDAPSLHTMYIDKPMHGHGLMQAIARVNRVFRDKPGGLVVDYIGLAGSLQRAVQTYSDSGGKGETAIDVAEAVAALQEKLEICRGLFDGFDVDAFLTGTPAQRLSLLAKAADFILGIDDGRERLLGAVLALSKANALCSAEEAAIAVREEVAFYQAVRAALVKSTVGTTRTQADVDLAIRQIVSKAIAADGVVDLFEAVGLKKPNLAILSDEFLAEVRHLPQRNLAAELLRKLLNDEVKARRRTNVVQAEAFSEKLERTVARYRNRSIQTIEVIEELISMAEEFKAADAKGQSLNLTQEEVAFYDALAANESAVQVLGDAVLTTIARELTVTIRENVSIDWTRKESVRAKLRSMVRRKLKKYGYPPDLAEKAVETVLKQAESFAAEVMA